MPSDDQQENKQRSSLRIKTLSRLTHPATDTFKFPQEAPGGEGRIDEMLGDAGLTRPSHEPDSPGRWRHVPSTNSLVNKRGRQAGNGVWGGASCFCLSRSRRLARNQSSTFTRPLPFSCRRDIGGVCQQGNDPVVAPLRNYLDLIFLLRHFVFFKFQFPGVVISVKLSSTWS